MALASRTELGDAARMPSSGETRSAPVGVAPFSKEPRQGGRYERQLQLKFIEAERLTALSPEMRQLFRKLSLLRRRLALDDRIPAYQVLSNHALLSLCEALPRPADSVTLAAIPGLSPVRIKAYGAEILAVLGGQELGLGRGDAARVRGSVGDGLARGSSRD